MKYYTGQVVTLLNTEYKPAGEAIICNYQHHSEKYEVDFKYPNQQLTHKIFVSEERLRPYAVATSGS
ncbi:MAG: hypothetical protein H7211_10610 [Aquabacterium sp.]|nr:hypothetical protein [Ferruginibacter sp.]